jgi:hypothetical protein
MEEVKMKKLIIVFLIAAGAGGLFAQGFNFGGSYDGGSGLLSLRKRT